MPICKKVCQETLKSRLQPIPETAACTAALSSDQQDAVLRPSQVRNDHSQSESRSSLTSPSSGNALSEYENRDGTSTMSSTARLGLELKSPLSITSLKNTIGTFSHGRIQWLHQDRVRTDDQIKNDLGVTRRSRPKINLVIPSGTKGRRHSAKPFVEPSNSQIRLEPAEQERPSGLSPPSGVNEISLCDSAVSPLTKPLPTGLGRFKHSIGAHVPNSNTQTYRHYRTVSETSASSVELQLSDASSTYSAQSSTTSAETERGLKDSMMEEQTTKKLEPQCPTVVEVLNVSSSQFNDTGTNSRQFETPPLLPRRYRRHSSIKSDQEFRPTCIIPPARLYRNSTKINQPSRQGTSRSILEPKSHMDLLDQSGSDIVSRHILNSFTEPSPTLSEAEMNLQEHLYSSTEQPKPNRLAGITARHTGFRKDNSSGYTDRTQAIQPSYQPMQRSEVGMICEHEASAPENMSTISFGVSPPPPLPRRSSKRRPLPNLEKLRFSHVTKEHTASQLTRSDSDETKTRLKTNILECKESDNQNHLPAQTTSTANNRIIAPDVAEGVLLNILRNLIHFNDLFVTATVNSGFYRVFKRHELDLIKSTMWNMSPPAWEYRQVAFPGHDFLHNEDLEMTRPKEEYTPSTYLQLHNRDASTIEAIKLLIRERCQSFLRPEILLALLSPDPTGAARVDDALWRIWTFCKLFGHGKGREEDIVAQMDWLTGGLLVHQPACTFSITVTDYMNDALLSAPEHFAKGNQGDLNAEQLFDMMELWNCLGVLLQNLEGHTAQAREFGVFDNTDIRGGDIDGEDSMLDEWCYYLLTLGLSTVLDLAGPHSLPKPSAFDVASRNGWTTWRPLVSGSTRRNFLKEAASRVYEDKIAHLYADSSSREVQREISKARIQKHITELQRRKNSGERITIARMSQEKPISEGDTVIDGLTRRRPISTAGKDLVSHIPSLQSATSNLALRQVLSIEIAELSAARIPSPSSPLGRTVAQPLLPTPTSSTVPSTRDRSSTSTSLTPINEYPAHGGYQEVRPLPSVSNYMISPQRYLRKGVDNALAFSQAVHDGSSLEAFWQPHVRNSTDRPVFSQPYAHANSNVPMTVYSRPNIQTSNHLPIYTQPHTCLGCNLPILSQQQHNCNPLISSHLRDSNHSGTSVISGSSAQGSLESAEQSVFQQHHQAQGNIYHSEKHIDTANKAIHRIMEMGFTADQASEALRMTDMGDGLRIDRAVEMLLRRAT